MCIILQFHVVCSTQRGGNSWISKFLLLAKLKAVGGAPTWDTYWYCWYERYCVILVILGIWLTSWARQAICRADRHLILYSGAHWVWPRHSIYLHNNIHTRHLHNIHTRHRHQHKGGKWVQGFSCCTIGSVLDFSFFLTFWKKATALQSIAVQAVIFPKKWKDLLDSRIYRNHIAGAFYDFLLWFCYPSKTKCLKDVGYLL